MTGQQIVSTEVTNHRHVQLLPAGRDNSDVFIQVLVLIMITMMMSIMMMIATIRVVYTLTVALIME